MSFRKAVKFESKLRLALAGPAGSGKTYTALTLATSLADGKGIAVIDTERGSASKYSDLFDFDVMELDTFHPDKFVQGIREAEEAGYAVLVIDSLSHAWNGPGGLLEIVETIAKRSSSKNTFNAWGEATPIQQRLVDALTRANLHIIVTMRSKTEYVVEQNAQGKSVPRKVGTAPIQREGLEYEFDVYGDLDHDNTLIVQKSRCPALAGKVIAKPDTHVADILKAWLSGAPAPERVPDHRQLYDKGKNKGLWTSGTGFYTFISDKLNQTITQINVTSLTETQRMQLAYVIDETQPTEAIV